MKLGQVIESKNKKSKVAGEKKGLSEALSPRERVLKTAVDLFYRYGVHRVGIDRIIDESRVARMTFYKHFPSKSKLIAEFLAYKDKEWFDLLESSTSDLSKPPEDRILAIFDSLYKFFESPVFHGCCFIRGLSEFRSPDDEPELGEIVAEHFLRTEALIEKLVLQVGIRDTRETVAAISGLISGAVVVAQSSGASKIALINKELARTVLASSKF